MTIATIAGARPASDKQIALITRLATEKDTLTLRAADADTLNSVQAGDTVGMRAASALIDSMFALPRRAAEGDVPTDEQGGPGYYVREGEVYVVVENKAGTNVYAKRLHVADGHAEWVYAPGVARTFRQSETLTAQQAAAFGHLHGFCVKCCKPLTDVRSNAAGYGATCAKKMGWPYPSAKEAAAILASRA